MVPPPLKDSLSFEQLTGSTFKRNWLSYSWA